MTQKKKECGHGKTKREETEKGKSLIGLFTCFESRLGNLSTKKILLEDCWIQRDSLAKRKDSFLFRLLHRAFPSKNPLDFASSVEFR